MTAILSSQHQVHRQGEWVQTLVGHVSDTQFVDEGVEFGVINALKLIFEHVYFQNISGDYITRPQESGDQKVARFSGGWISSEEYAKAQHYKMGYCNAISILTPLLAKCTVLHPAIAITITLAKA